MTTEDLRAELHRRDEIATVEAREQLALDYPCPECGAGPVCLESKVVERFVFAPRDDKGRPMLFTPYEMGEEKGCRYRLTVTCVNGHTTETDKTLWYEESAADLAEIPASAPHEPATEQEES